MSIAPMTVDPTPSTSTGPTVAQASELLAGSKADKAKAEAILKEILDKKSAVKDDGALREKEAALLKLGEIYRDRKDEKALETLIESSRTLLSTMAKAKTAKLIRQLLSFFPPSSPLQISTTRSQIQWAKEEKRVFLRQSLEINLGRLLFEAGSGAGTAAAGSGAVGSGALIKEALGLVAGLLKELKRLDDKMVLTEVHLLESRIRHAVSDGPKAKAALTSARTAANSIYCPPLLQAQLDMQSGVLHAEDKDYKTAYSYFFEALEGLSSQDDPKAALALKYMLMCKVMLNLPEDVVAIQNSKLAKQYAGRDTEAMQAVAKAHEERSLADFEKALQTYKTELSDDLTVRSHLSALYDTLLSQNLLRIIEPYSRLELSFISTSISLPLRDVEAKLSQMILDKEFKGILDQGAGCLEVFEGTEEGEEMYERAVETLKVVGNVVESLFAKAGKLSL